jgi:DNA-binding GntR family transcriptional regulator
MSMLSDPADESESVAARIGRILASRIIAGELPAGAPVRQDHVATEFAASHVPVREAFRMLEARGLLVSEPRRGVRVAPMRAATLLELTEMRAALETMALRHAAPHLESAAFAAAAAINTEAEASSDVLIWEAANRRFHRTLLAPARMPHLLATIDSLQASSARYLVAVWKELDWQKRSEREHRKLLICLRGGKTDEAVDVLHRHIIDAGRSLAKLLQ